MQFSCPDKIIVQHFLSYNFVILHRHTWTVYYNAYPRWTSHITWQQRVSGFQLMSMETSAFEPLYDGRFTFPYQLETEKNVEK